VISVHTPLAAQRLIANSSTISVLDQALYTEALGGPPRQSLAFVKDAEDQFAERRQEIREEEQRNEIFPFIGDLSDDDSDDDTKSYKTLRNARGGANRYDLVLVLTNTDFNMEQRRNFSQLLHSADGVTSNDPQERTIGHRYHHRFRSIFYPKKVEDIMDEICVEGNQRIVLAHDAYRKCIKFKKNVSKIVEEKTLRGQRSHSQRYMLPEFEIKVMPLRHSLKYNFGQKQKNKASYQVRQSVLATQQTRTKYQFQYTPVLKRIVDSNDHL